MTLTATITTGLAIGLTSAAASSLATPETIGLVLGAVVSIGAAARVAYRLMMWWIRRQLKKDPTDSELAAIAAAEQGAEDEEE